MGIFVVFISVVQIRYQGGIMWMINALLVSIIGREEGLYEAEQIDFGINC